ncbi:sodium channel modifier 1-like [Punica granatum]|uniref:Sodium channel modifier 1 n=1 Tax=Punica granatum TaxID=22663 RepID=A0A218XGD7_PUNGR|nr:sodium channel modifier 1-like [Punica granatum]OWM83749.1 hypothetical protein CDL15_Pgr004179 [Punica granatum]
MSVFGGDSWAREQHHRKRRVDDLAIEGLDGSCYRKLSNGKFACLVCPNSPVLDSPLMLAVHRNGSRHRAAESRLKEKELIRRDEINKRIALSGDSSTSSSSRISSKPLIEQTRHIAFEVLSRKPITEDAKGECINARFAVSGPSVVQSNPQESVSLPAKEASAGAVEQQQLVDFRECRERELKFTSAGWKRDGNGRWYKDENVEFDSDEEDPNVCLA